MSKADKMRGRLASIQKDRENFEKQKKELENDMNIGKKNMTKIQKGLKNNSIANEDIVVDHNIVSSGANIDSPLNSNNRKGRNSKVLSPPTGNRPRSERSPRSTSPTNASFSIQGTPTMHGKSMGGNFFPNPNNDNNSLSPRNQAAGQSQSNIIMPSGPRISEWCYTAPLDTIPPVVKSRAMYENVRHLGRGAFGEVSLVKNIEDNKLFAIKTQLCPKESEFQSVLHEIRFLRANRHPCIIDVHDAFLMLNPRIVHIVMHYCESGTLATTISSAKKNKINFSEIQIIKWIFQMALALQFLHDNKTIHRDLKPMNVMLTEGGEHVKIGDFGLAMSIKEDKQKESVDEAGTPYYTAPEMIMREPYSYPADCWSFGVIVHQMIALERPFDGSSTADLVKAVLKNDIPPLPAHYSDELKMLSFFLLRREPSERLSMSEVLANPIIYPKASSFSNAYRPRSLEERIRRQHCKQLEVQMETINSVKKKYQPLSERVKQIPGYISNNGSESGNASPSKPPVNESSKTIQSIESENTANQNNDGSNNAVEDAGSVDNPLKGISAIMSVSEDVSVDEITNSTNVNNNDINKASDNAAVNDGSDNNLPEEGSNENDTQLLSSKSCDSSPRYSKGVIPPRKAKSPTAELIDNNDGTNGTSEASDINNDVEGNTNDNGCNTGHIHGGRKGQALAKAIETDEYFEHQLENAANSPNNDLNNNTDTATDSTGLTGEG